MNRLSCPSCGQHTYTATLRGPLRCANDECGELILPGGEVDSPDDRRHMPRVNPRTQVTVEYLVEDIRTVEEDRPFLDASVSGISTVLNHFPTIGSRVVVVFENAGPEGGKWRVRGVVREVQPADEDGFRVGIEVKPVEGPGD